MDIDKIKTFLPEYLSTGSSQELFSGLKDFPYNIDGRMYTRLLNDHDVIFQGDGLSDMQIINLPNPTVGNAPVIVLSNTCDIDPANKRNFRSRICYAPIMQLEKYVESLKKRAILNEERLNQHIDNIKKQKITQVFYLPKGGSLKYEGIVFLDRINNCGSSVIPREKVAKRKLFILSDYGLYMFLLKLSIHFTRIKERVDRFKGQIK